MSVCAALFALPFLAAAGGGPPNVVIVLVDDLGTDHLGMYHELNPYQTDVSVPLANHQSATGDAPTGSLLYADTPWLDAFAAQGVRFDNAYAQPTCSPSRASLLTGAYPLRHGVGTIINPSSTGVLNEFGDPGYELTTLAELVQTQGYADRIVGKWHLGKPTPDMDPAGSATNLGWRSIPERGGWSSWACIFSSVIHHPVPPPAPLGACPEAKNTRTVGHGTYQNFVMAVDTVDQQQVSTFVCTPTTPNHETSVLFDDALAWCNAQAGQAPFLCLISLNTVHYPWEWGPPSSLINTCEYDPPGFQPETNAFRTYAAMIEAVDNELHRFYVGLDAGVREDTLFLFLGDNGGVSTPLGFARDMGTGTCGGVGLASVDLGPMYDFLLAPPAPSPPGARFKGVVFEKGIRVPMIAWGAGVTNGGRSSKALVQIEDVFATVTDLLGGFGTVPPDGTTFRWVLEDQSVPASARRHVWTQKFDTLGAPPAGALVHPDEQIGCSLWVPGSGRFKLIQRWRGGVQQPDLFYRLEDATRVFHDPWETAPIDVTAQFQSEYAQLVTLVNAILTS